MKQIYSLIIFIFFFQFAHSQQSKFSKIYYDQNLSFTANAITNSFDGGVAVCGILDYSSAIVKYDSTGVIVWAKKMGFGNNETFNSIAQTSDSCFIVAGKIYDLGAASLDVHILKVDQNGNILFDKTIHENNHQEAFSVRQTFDGGYILVGMEGGSNPNFKIIAIKFDSFGDVEWYKTYQWGNQANIAYSVKQTPDSGFAFIGYIENYPPYDGNGFLCKTDRFGNVEWVNKYNTISPTTFLGNDIAILPDGIISYSSTSSEYALIKTDFNGNNMWMETTGSIFSTPPCINCPSPKIKLLSNGNLVFATASTIMNSQSSIVNIDSSGNFNWAQYCYNSVNDVLEADDHGLFFLGNGPIYGVRTTTITTPHVGIIKTDSLGNADICTDPISSMSFTSGNLSSSPISFVTSSRSVNSATISVLTNSINLTEQASCVDFTGDVKNISNRNLNLFPNPSTSYIEIDLSKFNGKAEVNITDLLGQSLLKQNFNNSQDAHTILNHHLLPGIYLVAISNDEIQMSGKLIVQ